MEQPLNLSFKQRYADSVLELERLNKDLNSYLLQVQKYCQEVSWFHVCVGATGGREGGRLEQLPITGAKVPSSGKVMSCLGKGGRRGQGDLNNYLLQEALSNGKVVSCLWGGREGGRMGEKPEQLLVTGAEVLSRHARGKVVSCLCAGGGGGGGISKGDGVGSECVLEVKRLNKVVLCLRREEEKWVWMYLNNVNMEISTLLYINICEKKLVGIYQGAKIMVIHCLLVPKFAIRESWNSCLCQNGGIVWIFTQLKMSSLLTKLSHMFGERMWCYIAFLHPCKCGS